MPDVTIDQLHLSVDNAAGHEHRIGPIAERAVTILARRWSERFAPGAGLPESLVIGDLNAQPVFLDLGQISDEQSSERIAGALLEALGLELRM
jgi:hypothetical protein